MPADRFSPRRLATLAWLLLAMVAGSGLRAAEPGAKPVDFNREIRPLLSDRCFKCHGPDAQERQAGLRLDLRDAALGPAESGRAAIVPGQPDRSELVRRILATDPDVAMPPPDSPKQLTDAEKQRLKQWIAEGAGYQQHWAFIAPGRPEVPPVELAAWPRTPIDRFLLARLEREGLPPAPEADRATLIRRLTLDLTGLPPTPAEVEAFLLDNRTDAYERLVDRLLASPHYGERLAVDWLDAARYADTHGYHIDSHRDMWPWRAWVIAAFNRNLAYDAFTIEQLAGDLLPESTIEQRVASGFHRNHMINFEGGAIPEEYLAAYIVDRVNTTGTVWLGLSVGCAQCHDHKYDPISQREFYQLYAFFHQVPENGLDGREGNAQPMVQLPAPGQAERLAELRQKLAELETKIKAAFDKADAEYAEPPTVDVAQNGGAADRRPNDDPAQSLKAWLAKAKPSDKDLPAEVQAALRVAAGERNKQQTAVLRAHYLQRVCAQTRPTFEPLVRELDELKKQEAAAAAAIPSVMVMQELEKPRETFVLVRGQYDKLGEKVAAGVPAALAPFSAAASGSRLALARWLVDPRHPLTARVTVNRYWQMVFGTGLVKTAEDFGSQGEPPSHPELLDWLARDFVDHGWDVKRLLKQMVTSAAYRQSSHATSSLVARDPENRLLARGPRWRLQAEFIRDQALAISGLLDQRIGGPSVYPYQPPGLWEEMAFGGKFTAQTYTPSHGADLYRRTMYTFWKRTVPPAALSTFDAPDRETCTVRRARTNTPLQALVLMNDPTYVEAARKLAERLMTEAGPTPAERIERAFLLATARRPTPQETEVLRKIFDQQWAVYRQDREAATRLLAVGEAPRNDKLDVAELAAWSTVASVVLNLDETITKN